MNNKYLIVLKGVSCSGKSTFSNKVINDFKDITYLSSDKIAEDVFNLHNQPNTKEVFLYLNQKLYEAVDNNKNILIDATTLLKRYDTFYNNVIKNKGYKSICVCFDLDKESIETNINARHSDKWSHMSIEEIRNIVYRQKKSFTLPEEGLYDKVYIAKNNKDIDIIYTELKAFIK